MDAPALIRPRSASAPPLGRAPPPRACWRLNSGVAGRCYADSILMLDPDRTLALAETVAEAAERLRIRTAPT